MRRVIVLEKDESTPAGRYRFALSALVPAVRQGFYANAAAVSAFRDATEQELADLRAGAVVERLDSISIAPGTGIAVVQAQLQVAWQQFQSEVDNQNPWVRYGTSWDGTAWTSMGVN